MDKLEEYRKEINNIDRELVHLFEKRMQIAIEIGKYKQENNLPILNEAREREVIEKNITYLKNEDYKEGLKDFLNNLMNISKRVQKENFRVG